MGGQRTWCCHEEEIDARRNERKEVDEVENNSQNEVPDDLNEESLNAKGRSKMSSSMYGGLWDRYIVNMTFVDSVDPM